MLCFCASIGGKTHHRRRLVNHVVDLRPRRPLPRDLYPYPDSTSQVELKFSERSI